MPNPQPLTILTDLRKTAGLSLSDMARVCGLSGNQSHQTAGAWELGRMTPTVRRRAPFIRYLWDTLALRKQPAQFMQLWEILVEEWEWEPLSDAEWQRLTSAPRPTAVPPTVVPTRTAPFQAPALTPHFVGRHQEMADLCQRLLHPQPPAIYALVGMGGVGKTTLVTHIAHALRQHFADGVLWARVATTHPLDIAQSWAQAYSYDYSTLSDVESRGAALRGMLAEKQALLVLDDVTNPQAVRALLPGSGSAVVLLTTRDHDVAAALHAQRLTVAELSPPASLELMGLLLDPERLAAEPAAAQEICGALHHLPLAVEIAAQRLNVRERQKLSTLAAQLRDISARLDLALGDRAVRASFLSSWTLLDTKLQRVFACCGVFAGRSFPLAALAYIADLSPTAAEEMLFSLVALSLLKPEAPDCYRQHPLLADFAREQLGDDPVVDGRLADYYLVFARQHQTDYARLEPAWENIMAAMARAYARQQLTVVLAYAETLTAPWFTQARYTQARQGYTWAVASAQLLTDQRHLSNFVVKLGYVCSEQGDIASAQKFLQEGLTLAQVSEDLASLAEAHFHLARLAVDQGEYEEVEEHLSACQRIRLHLGDSCGVAAVLVKQADLLYRTGQMEQAEQLCQNALATQEQAHDIPGILSTLRMLSDIANMRQHYLLAQEYAQRLLTLAQAHQQQSEVAEAYFTLATVARYLKQYNQAWEYAESARQFFEHMGNLAFLASTLYEESVILKLTDQLVAALDKGQTSLALMATLKDEFNRIYCLYHVGDVYQRLGQPETARQRWQEGYERARILQHPFIERFAQVLHTC